MTIINLRGNNGSGKSTVVHTILKQFSSRPLFGVLGIKYPEAYHVTLPKTEPLFVLGPYTTLIGGVDRVSGRGFDVVISLLDRYSNRGHVLFEGAMISNSFGMIGQWLEGHKQESYVVFLDTPLEVCLQAVQERTGEASRSRWMEQKVIQLERVKANMIARGLRVKTVSRETAVCQVLGWLGSK
jgi:thymidylate kinase